MTDRVPTANIPNFEQIARQFIADHDWNDDEADDALAKLLEAFWTNGQNSVLVGSGIVDELPVNTSE